MGQQSLAIQPVMFRHIKVAQPPGVALLHSLGLIQLQVEHGQRAPHKESKMYVYIQSEPGLWTVGFYDPKGKWHPESDHSNQEDAAKRVAYLNGGRNE